MPAGCGGHWRPRQSIARHVFAPWGVHIIPASWSIVVKGNSLGFEWLVLCSWQPARAGWAHGAVFSRGREALGLGRGGFCPAAEQQT